MALALALALVLGGSAWPGGMSRFDVELSADGSVDALLLAAPDTVCEAAMPSSPCPPLPLPLPLPPTELRFSSWGREERR